MACDTPVYVRPKGYVEDIPVPCGKCPPCKKRRVDGWVFRMLQQEKVSTSARFVTLTYDPAHVPISPNGFMTLRKSDFQDYMKRLRNLCPDHTLKYYAVGEYGTENKRPHFHAIIFNVPNDDFFWDAWKLNGVPLGGIHIGQVCGNSIAYVMKYIDKASFKPMHVRDDRYPEFPLMSKGLGLNYITPAIVDYHHDDYSRTYLTRDGGHKIAMPRYYKKIIYSADDGGYQRRLAQLASDQAEYDNYKAYLRKYRHNPDFTYEMYVESQKYGRHTAFYASQKKRDI